MNKKAGLIFRLIVVTVAILAVFATCSKFSKAETSNAIANVTITANSTNVIINFSNIIYYFNSTNFTSSLSQNFPVDYQVNVTNVTVVTNVTCTNSTFSVSCSCPSVVSCPAVSCNVSGEVDLNNATKTEFYNHYITNLGTKIEESSNKAAQDIIFKLEPTKAEIEGCKQTAFNASIRQNEAERQRDEQTKNNQVITGFFESCRDEKKTLQVVFFAFIALIVVVAAFFTGIIERFGGFFGGGRI